jgi:hypothetical protein
MSKIKSIGITVRLPPPLYKKLADRAKAEGRSVNQEAIRLFRESLDRTLSREEGILEEVNRQEALLQKTKAGLARMQQSMADVEARISRLEPKIEGKQTQVVKAEDVPRTKAFPLQPAVPAEPLSETFPTSGLSRHKGWPTPCLHAHRLHQKPWPSGRK